MPAIARTTSKLEAAKGLEALQSRGIPASVKKVGKHWYISSNRPVSAQVILGQLGLVRNPIHPEAIESLKRYKDDVRAGHKDAAEYWRGQAGAYFTANPNRISLLEKAPDIVKRGVFELKTYGKISDYYSTPGKDRKVVDDWLIRIKHPSVYEVGTLEDRYIRIVKELSGKRNPILPAIGSAALTGVGLGIGFRLVDKIGKQFKKIKNPIHIEGKKYVLFCATPRETIAQRMASDLRKDGYLCRVHKLTGEYNGQYGVYVHGNNIPHLGNPKDTSEARHRADLIARIRQAQRERGVPVRTTGFQNWLTSDLEKMVRQMKANPRRIT